MTSQSLDDRLTAARSLLGISPCSVADPNAPPASTLFGGRAMKPQPSQEPGEPTTATRARSNSAGLDALAFLATQQQENDTAPTSAAPHVVSSQGTHVAPPPKHPQHGLRLVPSQHLLQQHQPLPPALFQKPHSTPITSSSDDDSEAMPPPPPRMVTRRRSLSNPEGMEKYSRRRFQLVLPASILEEELAEASAAMKAKEDEENLEREEEYFTQDDEDEEEHLSHEELLQRARSRLLEDLSQGSLNGEKGELTLPHALEKYKEVYNKNGRIGIYTPAERAAIIARFHSKRSRRVWNKKIRYNCRKNLADNRLRVKGRFVKRSTLEAQKKHAASKSSVSFSLDLTVEQPSLEQGDEDMPDVEDPDAGFCPTEDQPYRRRRRHTIT
ncbi:MAG: hypothetical protein SGILL_002707 [Bacillariaceae sp.]